MLEAISAALRPAIPHTACVSDTEDRQGERLVCFGHCIPVRSRNALDLPLPWTFHEQWSRKNISKQSSEAELVSGSAFLSLVFSKPSYGSRLVLYNHSPLLSLLITMPQLSLYPCCRPGIQPLSNQIKTTTGLWSNGCFYLFLLWIVNLLLVYMLFTRCCNG